MLALTFPPSRLAPLAVCQMSSNLPSPSSIFLDLPSEIRTKIYRHILPARDGALSVDRETQRVTWSYKSDAGISHTCRSTHAEAARIFSSRTTSLRTSLHRHHDTLQWLLPDGLVPRQMLVGIKHLTCEEPFGQIPADLLQCVSSVERITFEPLSISLHRSTFDIFAESQVHDRALTSMVKEQMPDKFDHSLRDLVTQKPGLVLEYRMILSRYVPLDPRFGALQHVDGERLVSLGNAEA